MNYPQIASRVFNRPLMIEPHAFGAVLEALSERMDFTVEPVEAFRPENARRTESGYLLQDGIAWIDVFGELVNRGAFLEAASGLTSYDRVGARFAAAMADPEVTAVLLHMDSPGGEVGGVFDLATRIRSARGTKPIVAALDSQASSAAYLLASAADRITIPPEGVAGSIGVVWAHRDRSEQNAKKGVAVTLIHQGARKVDGHPDRPLSDEARTRMEALTEHVYGMFTTAVAENRGIDLQSVIDTEADIYMGENAVAAGLADEVVSAREEFDRLRSETRASGRSLITARKEVEMTTKSDTGAGAANPEHEAAEAAIQARITAAVSAEREAGEQRMQEAVAAARTEAVTEDRERIAAIMDAEQAQGRGKLARRLALSTSMSAEDVISMLEDAPAETKAGLTPFEQVMRGSNVDVGADSPEPADQGDGADAAAAILASAKKAGVPGFNA